MGHHGKRGWGNLSGGGHHSGHPGNYDDSYRDSYPPPSSEARRAGAAPGSIFCSACGAAHDAAAAFCSECGVTLARPAAATCGACGAALSPGTRFCSACGEKVTA